MPLRSDIGRGSAGGSTCNLRSMNWGIGNSGRGAQGGAGKLRARSRRVHCAKRGDFVGGAQAAIGFSTLGSFRVPAAHAAAGAGGGEPGARGAVMVERDHAAWTSSRTAAAAARASKDTSCPHSAPIAAMCAQYFAGMTRPLSDQERTVTSATVTPRDRSASARAFAPPKALIVAI